MLKSLGRNNQFLMVALFIWALGEGLWYINLRQLYLVDLGASEAQVGIALAIEAAVRACLPIPAGYLSDRFGAQRIMVASWVIGLIAVLVGVWVTTWQMFLVALVIYAMSAFAVPSISLYVLQNLPDRGQPGVADRALTAVFSVYPAGLIISPVLGGVVADTWGIRVCLWIALILFIASTIVVAFTRHIAVPQDGVSHRPVELLKNRTFLQFVVYLGLVFIAMYIGFQLLPNYLQAVRGYSYGQIGFLFSILSAGNVVLNLLAGRVSPRWNFAIGLALYWGALLIFWQVDSIVATAAAFFIAGIIYVVRPVATARVSEIVSIRNQGLAFGVIETLMSIAMAVAAGFAGQLYDLTGPHTLPFIVGLAAVALMTALWFVVRRSLPLGDENSPAAATVPVE